jgi:hypothetical protein
MRGMQRNNNKTNKIHDIVVNLFYDVLMVDSYKPYKRVW